MIRRLAYLGAVLATIMAAPAGAQQADTFETKKAQATGLFLHGKVNAAIDVQRDVIAAAPSPHEKGLAQRDLMEMCATVQDWDCTARAMRTLLPIVRSDPQLASLELDILAYAAKHALWRQDDAALAAVLRDGGAATVHTLTNPAAAATLALALQDSSIRRNDLKSAEQHLSTAILGLLLSDQYGSYRQAELSVGVLQALLHAEDIVGAMTLANMLAPILPKLAPGDSVVAARYLMLRAHLSAYTEKYSATAEAFVKAGRAFEQLDIDEDTQVYQIAVANSLATAALLLDGKPAEASDLHAKHPLQRQKPAILDRGEFLTMQEFYFAVSDVFLSAARNERADLRWKRPFEKGFRWRAAERAADDFESYGNFALGILELHSGDIPKSARLLRLAARQRVDNFDAVLRANFEGFPLPSLMDWIIIGTGLSVANERGEREDLDLLLRGSEVLGRNLRHALVDTAVLLGAQSSDETRRAAQAYVHLLRRKRDWELDRIGRLLAGNGTLEARGELVRTYQSMMTTLASEKDRLLHEQKLAPTSGLPTLADLQKSIPAGDAFVTYYGSLDGIGKLCIRRDQVVRATAPAGDELPRHARLIEFATTASHPPNAELDAQFPVASAIYLREFFFGGLDSCVRPGTHVTVAFLRHFAAGVPLGALLAEAPPRAGDRYDLAKARWLIRDLSFSRVVSAREYLATLPYLGRAPASRPFLGIGDPRLDQPRLARLASGGLHASVPTASGPVRLAELPETAEELKTAAALFGAAGADVLTGENATEASFRAKPLGEYDVLHFASHGLIKEDVPGLTESALVLTHGDAADSFNDGLLSASEISRLALNARLVVLSACNTAKYDIAQASLGVQDLQAAFTVAGTPTLLASLWPVESASARDIVVGFLQEWRSPQTNGAADALARATRAYLAKADAPHQHPRFWAPFVVVGNGAVRGAPRGQ